MKFRATTEIDAPINACFAALADFEHTALRARRAGIDVERTDHLTTPGPGMSWRIEGPFRGRTRRAEVELVDYDAPEKMLFHLTSSGIDADITLTLSPESGRRTILETEVRIVPRNLTTRVALQSMKLAKPRMNRGFQKGLRKLARDIERRVSRS